MQKPHFNLLSFLLIAALAAMAIYYALHKRIVKAYRFLPSGPGAYKNRELGQVQHIVIHHTSSDSDTLLSVTQYHASPNHICPNGCPGISYHYVIDGNGVIYQTQPLDKVSYHVGGHNTTSIGVGLLGNFDAREVPQRQYVALIRILRRLVRKFPTAKIGGHRDLKDSTICPGRFEIGRAPCRERV